MICYRFENGRIVARRKGEFREEDHPRASDGRFGDKPGDSAATDDGPAWDNEDYYTDDDTEYFATTDFGDDDVRPFLRLNNIPSDVQSVADYMEVSDSQKEAILEYTKPDGYYSMNESARTCPDTLDCFGDEDRERFEAINALAEEQQQGEWSAPVNAYRGVNLSEEDQLRLLEQMEPGKEISFSGVTSMSLSPALPATKFSNNIVFEIKIKNGLPIYHLSDIPEEMEILHAHGTRYTVKAVVKDFLWEGDTQLT